MRPPGLWVGRRCCRRLLGWGAAWLAPLLHYSAASSTSCPHATPFHRRYLNAFFSGAVVERDERQEELCQGPMRVSDVYCGRCGARIGWRFCRDLLESQPNGNQAGSGRAGCTQRQRMRACLAHAQWIRPTSSAHACPMCLAPWAAGWALWRGQVQHTQGSAGRAADRRQQQQQQRRPAQPRLAAVQRGCRERVGRLMGPLGDC